MKWRLRAGKRLCRKSSALIVNCWKCGIYDIVLVVLFIRLRRGRQPCDPLYGGGIAVCRLPLKGGIFFGYGIGVLSFGGCFGHLPNYPTYSQLPHNHTPGSDFKQDWQRKMGILCPEACFDAGVFYDQFETQLTTTYYMI